MKTAIRNEVVTAKNSMFIHESEEFSLLDAENSIKFELTDAEFSYLESNWDDLKQEEHDEKELQLICSDMFDYINSDLFMSEDCAATVQEFIELDCYTLSPKRFNKIEYLTFEDIISKNYDSGFEFYSNIY